MDKPQLSKPSAGVALFAGMNIPYMVGHFTPTRICPSTPASTGCLHIEHAQRHCYCALSRMQGRCQGTLTMPPCHPGGARRFDSRIKASKNPVNPGRFGPRPVVGLDPSSSIRMKKRGRLLTGRTSPWTGALGVIGWSSGLIDCHAGARQALLHRPRPQGRWIRSRGHPEPSWAPIFISSVCAPPTGPGPTKAASEELRKAWACPLVVVGDTHHHERYRPSVCGDATPGATTTTWAKAAWGSADTSTQTTPCRAGPTKACSSSVGRIP